MNNQKQKTQPISPGEFTVDQIQDLLKRDLNVAIRCLDAVYKDPDLLRQMAIFMHGRLENHFAQQQLSNAPSV